MIRPYGPTSPSSRVGSATGQAAVLFWSNRYAVSDKVVRVGVHLLAASAATGFGYALYRVWFVLHQGDAKKFDDHGLPVPVSDTLCELLPGVSILLLVLGLSVPPTRTLARYLRDQYSLWRLHPLWTDLVTAVPHVSLTRPAGRWRELCTLGDRSLDVAHRAFAMRDAVLVLRGSAPAGPALPPAVATGRDRASLEARWLVATVRSRSTGSPPPALPPGITDTPGGRTPREEVAWFLEVAAAYGERPDNSR